LIDGKLAFTFMGSKRCLISLDTAEKIRAIDASKIIVIP